jgi:Fe-S-cluster-containing dehydrogenase component
MSSVNDTLPLPVVGADDDRDEFPDLADPRAAPDDRSAAITRRSVLQGAAFAALSALGGCFRQPPEQLVPYRATPVEVRPGVPLHYATATIRGGWAVPLVVQSREGRPIKIEGNPQHPWSLGATSAFDQAELLELYDPSRLRVFQHAGRDVARQEAMTALHALGVRAALDEGEGLALLVEPQASPLLTQLRRRVLERYPRARLFGWAPVNGADEVQGARLAFGEDVQPVPQLERAKVVFALDADFLFHLPHSLRHARAFTQHREPDRPMHRLYVAEAQVSVTGMFADHRLRLRPSRLHQVAFGLVAALAEELDSDRLRQLAQASPPSALDGREGSFVRALAKDLADHRGECLLLPGFRLPPAVHAALHAANAELGNLGNTLLLRAPSLYPRTGGVDDLRAFVAHARAGGVHTALITAFDPVYSAPGDLDVAGALRQLDDCFYLGMHPDQTSAVAKWTLPRTHTLETWGDAQSIDGMVAFIQPLIHPLFDAVSEVEVLLHLLGEAELTPHRALERHWSARGDWDEWITLGLVPDSEAPVLERSPRWAQIVAAVRAFRPAPAGGFDLNVLPSSTVFDGRYSHNAWLQELPDPISKVTWDNVATVSPATARRLGLDTEDRVAVRLRGREVVLPCFVLPGHADDAVTVQLGYGRRGPLDEPEPEVGVNVAPLRTTHEPWIAPGADVVKLSGRVPLARAQLEGSQHGRPLALRRTLSQWEEAPSQLHHMKKPPHLMYQPFTYADADYKWGMAVDLTRCIGCAACVVACQAENNVPSVGREQVRLGREMHWLRIDRYFVGEDGDPQFVTQPLMCVHCEMAPCEYVCPVNATVHSSEGLNEMIYNRCIGTRYCSNNCPYKVRRFNYLDYHPVVRPLERMRKNPEVTVRARGVMEKCTYCVQRIERARIDARVRDQRIDTGALQTACEQACPTRAIVFGDLHREDSEVYRKYESDRAYALLHHLGTQPRTRHLVRITNPNQALLPGEEP